MLHVFNFRAEIPKLADDGRAYSVPLAAVFGGKHQLNSISNNTFLMLLYLIFICSSTAKLLLIIVTFPENTL